MHHTPLQGSILERPKGGEASRFAEKTFLVEFPTAHSKGHLGLEFPASPIMTRQFRKLACLGLLALSSFFLRRDREL